MLLQKEKEELRRQLTALQLEKDSEKRHLEEELLREQMARLQLQQELQQLRRTTPRGTAGGFERHDSTSDSLALLASTMEVSRPSSSSSSKACIIL